VLRVLKIVKIVRIAKLVKLTDPNSALADAMEDLFLTSHWAAATRVLFLLVLAFFCAHLLACSMAATGDGWYESYSPGPRDDMDPSDWYWGRQYLVALYWAFTTMTTVGYGDVTPQTDEERIFCIFAMIIGVAFYSCRRRVPTPSTREDRRDVVCVGTSSRPSRRWSRRRTRSRRSIANAWSSSGRG
jgi:hypothetical protein